jgi:hypothetical protein
MDWQQEAPDSELLQVQWKPVGSAPRGAANNGAKEEEELDLMCHSPPLSPSPSEMMQTLALGADSAFGRFRPIQCGSQ